MVALLLRLSGAGLEAVGAAVGRSFSSVSSARVRARELCAADERFAKTWALALESFGVTS